jgi:hypothetical protein
MNILDTISADLKAGVGWVEKEAGVVLTEAEKAADTALQTIWADAKLIFTEAAPTIVADVLAALKTFVAGIAPGQTLQDIETAFLNDLEAAGHTLLPVVQKMGSALLQALIGIALAALKLPV